MVGQEVQLFERCDEAPSINSNHSGSSLVLDSNGSTRETDSMSFMKKLFKGRPATQRVRICVECGMPIAEHKDWCSIFRTMQEREAATAVAE